MIADSKLQTEAREPMWRRVKMRMTLKKPIVMKTRTVDAMVCKIYTFRPAWPTTIQAAKSPVKDMHCEHNTLNMIFV
jgi:hypothetical protein